MVFQAVDLICMQVTLSEAQAWSTATQTCLRNAVQVVAVWRVMLCERMKASDKGCLCTDQWGGGGAGGGAAPDAAHHGHAGLRLLALLDAF